MQHVTGVPLPPSHGPGVTGAAGAVQHPGHPAPPGQPPATGGPPPAGGQVPAPGWPGQGAQPAPAQPAPPHHTAPPMAAPSGPPPPPADGTTGPVTLPPGAPVPLPDAPQDQPVIDASRAAVAVLLIGPAGAGKTTVARLWADNRRVPTAHISLDDVREWVRSGFANPQSGWNENSEAQYRLARRTCGFAARNFLANGISCILDDAVFPDRPVVGLGGWKRHVGPGLLPVVLLPGLEVVLERNAARSGNRRLSDEEVARIHGRMAGWYGSGLPIIDNSTYDVTQTAQALDEAIARSIASPPTW
ncbi:AAA family ATPase [Streptomyces sp. 796.1]|uniref:AAA family ATPase n=1 Tax=Streptomyces sp. 796.1 TaxID=3163029 RepID=UPI0039C8C544